MNPRLAVLAAGLFGATAVVSGAFGAHALRAFLLERGMAAVWETAVQFQLVHAVALLALGAWWGAQPEGTRARRAAWAARSWCAGIVLFSGSLYLLAAGGPRWLGPVTPLGGLALIAGWAGVIAAALPEPRK